MQKGSWYVVTCLLHTSLPIFPAAEADFEYYVVQAPYSLTKNGATTPTEGKE